MLNQWVPIRNFIRNKATIVGDEVRLSNRRVMKKIQMGKARPAIFYQFDQFIELSDGSVIKRKSQIPKDELRMINDQRNSIKWNPHRSDLDTSDLTAAGKIGKFKAKFAQFEGEQVANQKDSTPESQEALRSKEKERARQKDKELVEMMGEDAVEIVGGGNLYDKKAETKRRKGK
ncbi:unnamed protein product [Candida verbasci]|uniref:Ribosomal protein bL31m N-terminal domain-containing protein n=1 Tax=Candida verbasci TaxID=1227364 RepID=A0A9W4U0I8_9ASCO|nr:unnamed protein product [Candida verbasci]